MSDSPNAGAGSPSRFFSSGDHLSALNAWLDYQLGRWELWARERDNSWLGLPSGNPAFPTMGHFMRHAFTPLHRYSDQIAGSDPLDDSTVATDDWHVLIAHAKACIDRHREVCSSQQPEDFSRMVEFKTRSAGILHKSRGLALTHAATHCVWHLGGVAHMLRSQGIEPPGRSDLIFLGD
ncbi:hypothetical protein IT575_06760 [bacterium]|nr:hypothetical protein [bacterium]